MTGSAPSRHTVSHPPPSRPSLSRRAALARLGLGVAVAYTAPSVLHLDRSAKAVQPSCTGKGRGANPKPWCKASGK